MKLLNSNIITKILAIILYTDGSGKAQSQNYRKIPVTVFLILICLNLIPFESM